MKKRRRFTNNAVVINSQRTLSLTTETDESSVYESFPIACFLTGGKMHGQLSNAWDEYKIEAVEITVTPSGTEEIKDEDKRTTYIRFFTCIDNNRPPVNVSYSLIKANSTYSDTTYALNSSNIAPIHRATFNMDQRYTSTKTTSPLGTLTLGLASSETFDEPVTTWWSCNFRFHVSYRKARVDTGYITTMIPSSMPEIKGVGLTYATIPPPPVPPPPVPPPPPAKPVLNCVGIRSGGGLVKRFENFSKITTDTTVEVSPGNAVVSYRGIAGDLSAGFLIFTDGSSAYYAEIEASRTRPAWFTQIISPNISGTTILFGEYIEDNPNGLDAKVGIDPQEITTNRLRTKCYFYKSVFDIQGFDYDDDENI